MNRENVEEKLKPIVERPDDCGFNVYLASITENEKKLRILKKINVSTQAIIR